MIYERRIWHSFWYWDIIWTKACLITYPLLFLLLLIPSWEYALHFFFSFYKEASLVKLFHCYFPSCNTSSSDPAYILRHCVNIHQDNTSNDRFSIRWEKLHSSEGYSYLQSVHFDIRLRDIVSRINNDQGPILRKWIRD